MFLVDVSKVWSWITENRNLVLAAVCFVVLSVFLLSSCTEEQSNNATFADEEVEVEVIDALPPGIEGDDKELNLNSEGDGNETVHHTIKRKNFVNAYTIVNNN